jgi:3'(2'), 5'-bisphosphate nucleotidase
MQASKKFIDSILSPLEETVRKSSSAIMEVYASNELDRQDKKDGSPVTKADLAANNIILSDLKKLTPEIPIISEETFSNKNIDHGYSLFWIVDPLDGTREFINKSDEFTVNIALIEKKIPIFGIVGAPALSKLWHGSIFETQSINSFNEDAPIRIVMSKSHKTETDELFLDHLKNKNFNFELVERGSSLKICSLADDEADFYPRFGPTSEWDIAAADAFLRSRGGEILKASNFTALEYGKSDSILNPYFFCFRNEPVKQKIMPILGEFNKKLL